jgi:hypothetical protein
MSNSAPPRANAPESRSLPLAEFFETAKALAVFNSHRSRGRSDMQAGFKYCPHGRPIADESMIA